MLKRTFLILILALAVGAWSNLRLEAVPSSNPFVGNKFRITNIKSFLEDRVMWISFGEKKLQFNGCSEEEKFTGAYTIKQKDKEGHQFQFELEAPFEVEMGCRSVNIIKAVLNSGAVITFGSKEGSFVLANPNYPSAYLQFQKILLK